MHHLINLDTLASGINPIRSVPNYRDVKLLKLPMLKYILCYMGLNIDVVKKIPTHVLKLGTVAFLV